MILQGRGPAAPLEASNMNEENTPSNDASEYGSSSEKPRSNWVEIYALAAFFLARASAFGSGSSPTTETSG